MNFKQIIFRYLIIILGGVLIFFLDEKEIFNAKFNTSLVLILAFSKLTYLIYVSYQKILEVSFKNIPFHKLLVFMFIDVAVVIVSFAVDFLCLYQIDVQNFQGIPDNLSYFDLMFEFIYLSMLGFNNLGFYDVIPKSMASKFLVMLEIISYFLTIVFVLSDFISLKESIIEAKAQRENDA